MNKSIISQFAAALTFLGGWSHALAQSTAFTYQGRLNHAGSPADDLYEISFALYDAPTNGNVVGTPVTIAPVLVSNGLFTVTLDFGPAAFMGAERWLEISVNLFGSDMVATTIQPRQPIRATPYALHAANAAGLMSFGNAPLDIKVNGERALRLEPTVMPNSGEGRGAPNLIGGSPDNSVVAGVVGATIGGGGATTWYDGGYVNHVAGNFGTVSGGLGNTASGEHATVSGGFLNLSSGIESTVGGGQNNSSSARGATIGGGLLNRADGDLSTVSGGQENQVFGAAHATIAGGLGNSAMADFSTIGGGQRNGIVSGPAEATEATIAGGAANRISGLASVAFIGGGAGNYIEDAGAAAIGGGQQNGIVGRSSYSVIGGGHDNAVFSNSLQATISGGGQNRIGQDAANATVSGGEQNRIEAGADRGVIAGGARNALHPDAHESVIGGGSDNRIHRSAWSTIGGGNDNVIASNAFYATVAGGRSLVIGERANNATIGGGDANTIGSEAAYSSIGGGEANRVEAVASFATVAGGAGNQIGGFAPYATIAGGGYSVIESNAAHGTVGGGLLNRIESRAAYATIPGGQKARAANFGQMAYATGSFAEAGDAQISSYVLRRTTTNDTKTELMLDGDGYFDGSEFQGPPLHRMSLAAGGRWSFDILIVASAEDGTTAGYQARGVIKRVGDTTSLVGTTRPTSLGVDLAALGWSVTVEADDAHDALVIRARGDAARTVRWMANARVAELIH